MTHNAPGHLAHGVDGKRIVARAYAVLDSYIYGFVHTELNLPFQNTDETREVGKEIFDQLPPGSLPHLVELATEHVLKPGYSFGNEFEFGLELILDGLDRARKRARSPTPAAKS